MQFLRRRWPIIFLALVPLLVLWPAVFGGQAIGEWDHIRAMGPTYGPQPQTPWDVLQADGVLQFAPWRMLVFDSWSHGQIPAWNNYQLMGTPLLANSQSAGFYPLHILIGVLHVPLYPAMTFLAWFHLFWAGLGCYVLVRRMGGSKAGGAVAGASFATSAFMVYWTALPSVITTVSWIPWALACVMGMFQSELYWGIAEDPHYRPTITSREEALKRVVSQVRSKHGWTAGLMSSIAMMVLAGHLQFLAFGLMAVVVVALAMAIKLLVPMRRRSLSIIRMNVNSREAEGERTVSRGPLLWLPALSPFARVLFAIVVGLCIAAPQLLPVLNFSKQSHRRAPASAEGYASYASSALQPFEWAGLEFPKMLGDPAQSMGDPQNHSLFWAALAKRGDSFGESALSIGPFVLCLLCCLPLAGWKRGLPIVAVGILALLIACGTPFDMLLYYGVPGWSSTGSPGRAIVLFVLACCCLAGLSIRPLDARGQSRTARGLAIFVLLSAALWFLAVGELAGMESFAPSLGSLDPFIRQARSIDAPWMLISGMLVIGAIALWIFRGIRTSAVLVIVAPIAVVVLSIGVLRFGAPIEPVAQANSFERHAFANDSWNLFATPEANTPPNLATLLRVHDVAGYDSLLDKETKQLLDNANNQDSSPPENGNMMFIKRSANPAALGSLGVSDWNLYAEKPFPNNLGIWPVIKQIPGPGRVSSTGGSAQIISEDYRSITIEADGPGVLTLRDRNMPGWSTRVDGDPTAIAGDPFRQVSLPPGAHRVEFTYWPPGLTQGFGLLILGLAPLFANLLRWSRKSP